MTGPRQESGCSRPSLYLTKTHPCAYLERRFARNLFVDPRAEMTGRLYERLLGVGFRRSGAHIYRPACLPCERCVPLRIPVARFAPNRSQRRAVRRNADLVVREYPAVFDPEHYALYATYVSSRHAGSTMAENPTPESYHDFLLAPWGGESRLLELRLGARLLGVAVTDCLANALSAVYTYFDPSLGARALGTYAILCQIDLARRLDRSYLYLGYWIEECRKMSYKEGYRPVQALMGGYWREYARGFRIDWRESSVFSGTGAPRT